MKEIESLTTEFTHLISHKIRLKMQTRVSGQLISLRLDLDLEELTIFTTSAQAITSRLHLAWMYQREKALTHIMIT